MGNLSAGESVPSRPVLLPLLGLPFWSPLPCMFFFRIPTQRSKSDASTSVVQVHAVFTTELRGARPKQLPDMSLNSNDLRSEESEMSPICPLSEPTQVNESDPLKRRAEPVTVTDKKRLNVAHHFWAPRSVG